MAFKDIFKDENDFNEKTIIGFMSFAIMGMYSAVDLVTFPVGMNWRWEVHTAVLEHYRFGY